MGAYRVSESVQGTFCRQRPHDLREHTQRYSDLGYKDTETDDWYVHRAGVFSWVESSGYGIKNLNVNATKLEAMYVGGIVYGLRSGTIENCHITGNIGERHYDGSALASETYNSDGIVGYMSDGIIRNCTVNGTVTACGVAGGIVAEMTGGSIESCEVMDNSDVLAGRREDADRYIAYAEGIVGSANIALTESITNCKFNGTVQATVRDWSNNVGKYTPNVYCGGIVGFLTGGTLQSNHVLSEAIIFSDYTAGGIAGFPSELGCERVGAAISITTSSPVPNATTRLSLRESLA